MYFSHLLARANPDGRKVLDGLIFAHIPDALAPPSPDFVNLYQNVVSEEVDDLSTHPRLSEQERERLGDEAPPDPHFGDVFFGENGAVLIIATAECDLAYAPESTSERVFDPEMPVLLVPGVPISSEREPLSQRLLDRELTSGPTARRNYVFRECIRAESRPRCPSPSLGEFCVHVIARTICSVLNGHEEIISGQERPSISAAVVGLPFDRRRQCRLRDSRRAQAIHVQTHFNAMAGANNYAWSETAIRLSWHVRCVELEVRLATIEDVAIGDVEDRFL
jgi:hypothetical protein